MRCYLAGHTGLVGSALLRGWADRPEIEWLTATRRELDLTDGLAVTRWLASVKPDAVIMAAGHVGGIAANTQAPAQFIYDNLMIEANLIHATWKSGARRLINFGSACMYPHECAQPMSPSRLMTGILEPTSEPYAMAKLAGWSMCAAYNRQYGTEFITVIPCTLYGPGDSFGLESHVISALLRKFHDAKAHGRREVTLWGTGAPRREFLFADDVAEACELVLKRYTGEAPVNIGAGGAISIRHVAQLAAEIVGFEGTLHWDVSQPDGAPMKLLDSSMLRALGWSPRTSLRDGMAKTYAWFLEHEPVVQQETSCASS